ncbi:MAG: hypothetical protein HY554_03485 [Elusimicrobia bacterium]|nr:hypothetical protein [Elusimicrobiota bacterium]
MARLDRGWIIANHKLVSFHAAFLTSLLSISPDIASRWDVLRQMFLSSELAVSSAIWYLAWHLNVAVHEIGHYLEAVRTNNLRPDLSVAAQARLSAGLGARAAWYAEMLLKVPYGIFPGVTKEAGSYHPSVKAQNLAVSAAGPRASRDLCLATLPAGLALIAAGLALDLPRAEWIVVVGRLLGSIGCVAFLDFLLSDPGKYREFQQRQQEAAEKVREVRAAGGGSPAKGYKWTPVKPSEIKRKLQVHRLQEVALEDGSAVFAPWEFRNSIMGGRHTEEMGGNLSFQEFMFIPLAAKDYIEAQRITNALQTRVIQIIQDSPGLNFVGIGLEGGVVASYARGEGDILPEERAFKVAVQAIEECGFVPDKDVCLALDAAASELSKAYRDQTGEKESIGQYQFWRAEEPKTVTTDELIALYKRWVRDYPIVSIEDPFAEDDPEGWRKLVRELGDDIFVIGDDLVTTKDTTIARCAEEGLINAALIKANQIGTLSETLLATRAAKDRGMALVVSHRSKSPNEVMEADIAFAVGAMGLKCGGGSNTERLIKYGRIVELIELAQRGAKITRPLEADLVIADITAHEEPTNAGLPTVGVIVRLDNGMKFCAATPVGTSAGTEEAIHLVDSLVEAGPLTRKHPELFERDGSSGFWRFAPSAKAEAITAAGDNELAGLWMRAKRYGGKGCLNAVANVEQVIAPRFLGRRLSQLGTLADVDRELLALELDLALKRGKLRRDAPAGERIAAAQRKANLGMNAVLSASLALGRLIAARDGKELPEILRELEGTLERDALYAGRERVAA